MYRHPYHTHDQEEPITPAEERTPDALDERTTVELRLASLNA